MTDRLPGRSAMLALAACLMFATSSPAGISLGISVPAAKANTADLARFTKNTDITPHLVEIPANLEPTSSSSSLPDAAIEAIRGIGAVPVIAWMLPASPIDGTWDAALRTLARETRAKDCAIWMRLALPRGNEPVDAEDHKATFRRVVEIFREEGATNVRWMFVADVGRSDGPEAPLDENAFPGSEVVDLVALRGLNWGDTRESRLHGWDSEWETFTAIFEKSRAEWQARAPDKPLVAITATASTGGRKTDWVLDAVRTAADWNLTALVWFQHKETLDWAIQESIPRETMMEAQAQNTPLAK